MSSWSTTKSQSRLCGYWLEKKMASVTGRVLGTRVEAEKVRRGSNVNEELAKISALRDESRWPINSDPKPDTESANNRAHEAFLNACEWPTANNNWLARRGHPLTPVMGENKYHRWIDVVQLGQLASPHKHTPYSLDDAQGDVNKMQHDDPDADFIWHGRVKPLRPLSPQRLTRHIIQGGISEALDIGYSRAATVIWEGLPSAAMKPNIVTNAAMSAARKEDIRKSSHAHTDIAPVLVQQHQQSIAHAHAKGFRVGSAAHRRATGGRPATWPV